MKTRDITVMAICTALMCVLSPLSIPLTGGVPISLATFVVMVFGVVLKQNKTVIVVALYLIIGLIGIPVYGSFTSGASILFGMTGGYLFGYVILGYITGLFSSISKNKDKKTRNLYLIGGMVFGTVVLYLVGTIYFMKFTGMDLASSMAACVIPFIPGDIIKMVITLVISPRLETIVDKK